MKDATLRLVRLRDRLIQTNSKFVIVGATVIVAVAAGCYSYYAGKTLRLARDQGDSPALSDQTITIDRDSALQTIDGFGAAGAFFAAPLNNRQADLFFTTDG